MPAQDRGWTTRQMRVLLLVLASGCLIAFVLLRGGREPASPPEAGAEERVVEAPPDGDPAVEVDAPALDRPAGRFVVSARELEDVAAGLAAGDAALEAGRIFEPAGENALEYYLGVLAVDPDNEAAREGLDAVVALLQRAFDASLRERDLARAARILDAQRAAGVDAAAVEAHAQRLATLERAEDFLVAGRADREAGRLTRPPGANALERLARARALDPRHPALEAELSRLETEVISRALDAAREAAFPRALALIGRTEAALGTSGRLAEARRSIEAYREGLIDDAARRVRKAMERAAFDEAEASLARVRALGASESRIEALSEAIAHARVYGRFEPGQTFRDRLDGAAEGPEMIVLPHGEFWMGSPPDEPGHEPWEAPRHRVRLRRGFALGVTEVTVGEFRDFVEATGYRTDAETEGRSVIYEADRGRMIERRGVTWQDGYTGREADDADPVIHVSWNDAAAYAHWLAQATGEPYRLPSEAEFEYAVRAGSSAPYWWGSGSPEEPLENLTGSGDRLGSSRRRWARAFPDYSDGYWGPAPAGALGKNPFGVNDLAGNVEEWVEDCWHDSYVRAPSDGTPWVNPGCPRRVVRGGFWGGAPETARSAYRAHYPTVQRGSSIGFRVARDLY